VVLLAVAVVAVPVTLEARSISEVGYFWQGRYTLPLAVGLPLLAAASSRTRAGRWATPVLLGVLAVCHLVSFVVALGRYTVGKGQGLGLLGGDWAPPLPALVLVVAFGLTLALWAVWLVRLGRDPAPESSSGEAAAEEDQPVERSARWASRR